MTKLDKYWPTKENLNSVCVQEAENISEAILLAIHQALEFQEINPFNNKKERVNENYFYENFLETKEDLGEQNKFVVVEGTSGVGKSHYIKWLHAKLKSHKDIEKFHIVWLPKNINLKKVFQLILERFKDDENFLELADRLDDQLSLVDNDPGTSFAHGLEFALRDKEETLRNQFQELKDAVNRDKEKIIQIQAEISLAVSLKELILEPSLRDYFIENTFKRIIKRSLDGQDLEEYESFQDFTYEDLKTAIDKVETNELNLRVQNFINQKLKINDESGYNTAIDFLNKLVDESVRGAFNFSQVMGGVSFRDLIFEIRKKLYVKDKDMQLIFLIEDFELMKGIQEELLQIFLTYVPDKEMCTIRTALAVTNNFFSGKTTLGQRTTRLLIDQNLIDDKLVYDKVTEMIGARLNAARWGLENLQNQLSENSNPDTNEWVQVFNDTEINEDQQKIINSFGKSKKGYHLFPFNKKAIISMVNLEMTKSQSLELIARNVVNKILRQPLNTFRDNYIRDEFPANNFFSSTILNPEVDEKISRLPYDAATKIKYKNLICHWDGNPISFDKISLPSDIYKAFNLKPLKEIENLPDEEIFEEENPHSEEDILKDKTSKELEIPTNVKSLLDAVDSWHKGEQGLNHNNANTIRRIINYFCFERIDWNKLSIRPKHFNASFFDIKNAAGNQNTQIKLGSYDNSRVTLFFKAAINISWCRNNRHGNTIPCTCCKHENLNSPKLMEDYIRVVNFIDELMPDIENWLKLEIEEYLIPVTKLIEKHSKFLGFENVTKGKKSKVIENILTTEENLPKFECKDLEKFNTLPSLKIWHEIKMFAYKERDKFLEYVNDHACYRQGGTKNNTTILIHDIDRIYEAYLNNKDTEQTFKKIVPPEHRNNIRDNRLTPIVNKVSEEFKNFGSKYLDFTNNLDNDEIIQFEKIIRMCRQNGISLENNNFDNLLTSLKLVFEQDMSSYKSQYKSFLNNFSQDNSEKNISNLGKLDTVNLYDLNNLISSLNLAVEQLQIRINQFKSNSGLSDAKEIQDNLSKRISDNLDTLSNL